MTALVSFERVFEVLDLPTLVAEKPDAVALPRRRRVARRVRPRRASRYPRADEVSLASPRGGGPQGVRATRGRCSHDISLHRRARARWSPWSARRGAGKTTITHLVARLYDVTGGAVRVGGHDVRDVTLQSLEDAVGYVTQDAHMFHDTIRANLLYARPERRRRAIWARPRGRAGRAGWCERLPDGLDTVVGDRGYRLSGGERQRLAIARLLLKAPAIVVLDEATAHLDSESEAAVQRALDAALEGRTSLVIAHRLSTVRNADQILVLDEGRIVQRARTPSCWPRAASTPTSTAPSSARTPDPAADVVPAVEQLT